MYTIIIMNSYKRVPFRLSKRFKIISYLIEKEEIMAKTQIVNPSFWAKKQENNGIYEWLPLKQHLLDVTEVSLMLWHHWLSNGQRELVINSLDSPTEAIAVKLITFLGATHDLAKATPVFQAKPGFNNSPDLDQELIERLRLEGFDDLGSKINPSSNRSHHALAGQALLTHYGVRDDIASIIGGHHGKPVDDKKQLKDDFSGYKSNYYQVDDADNPIYQKWDQAQKELFKWALKQADFDEVEELPKINQTGQVLLEGLLIMADWIASNERYFPLFELDQHESPDQKQRLINGWKQWQPTRNWTPDPINDVEATFEDRFGFGPRDIQTTLAQTLEQVWEPGIIILEAPMGGGKTEAALFAAEQLATKTGRSGIFFGLPTQATSNGIFDRIKAWSDKMAQISGESKSIQLVHGKSALNDNFKSIVRNINIDAGNQEAIVVNEWFSGRKTSTLDDFVVGTIDQLLMTALKQKHLALRHLGISKKVVILDEIHAYDAYMSQYLSKALYWLGAYQVPVIILSATLPTTTRVKLMEAYMRGSGLKWNDVLKPNQWETNEAYPLITYNDGNQVLQNMNFKHAIEKQFKVKKIKETQLLELVQALIHQENVLGIIFNTVKRAQTFAKLCSKQFGEDKVQLLHSNFIATERIKKEKELLNTIGKNAQRPKGQIIIGTQVIEQSLDIDLDVMISDLAPMDLLLQRMGRLHRHDDSFRPASCQEPVLYVLGTSETLEFESGSTAVYGDFLLTRTQYYLPEIITLPTDISKLVQKVYRQDELVLTGELQSRYYKAKLDHENSILQQKSKAASYQIAKPNFSKRASLIGWLQYQARINSEEEGRAQVRDIEPSIEVIALKQNEGGYAFYGEEENIADRIISSQVSKEVAKQTLRLPRALATQWKFDQTLAELESYNRSKLSKWQELPWLKGTLGILFDENNQFKLNGYILTYDEQLGLLSEEEGENESF